MGYVPLIIDSTAPVVGDDGQHWSVLALPAGAASVFEQAVAWLAELQPRMVVWLRTTDTAPSVPMSLGKAGPAVRCVTGEQLDRVIEDLDSSDLFVVLDTRSWPAPWPHPREMRDAGREYHGATHAIAVGNRLDRAVERIESDHAGQIRRVQRLYATANWPEVAGHSIAYSVVPVRALWGVRFDSIGELRHQLTVRGVLTRDKPVSCRILNLQQIDCYLAFSEQVLVRASRGPVPSGYRSSPGGVRVAGGCTIPRSARLVSHVLVRENVVIGDNVTIVGPTIIGPGVQIEDEAVIAQAVVLPGTTVPRGAIVRHQVIDARGVSTEPSPDSPVHDDVAAPTDSSFVPLELTAPPVHDARRIERVAKRAFDVLVSASALIVLSPLLLLIALLVWLDSPGPVLFGHIRERRGGKEFKCLKFRTMVPDADRRQRDLFDKNQVDGPQFKLANDPRVTRVGRWLRASNLDELPQLFNVLVGHMSLVGPRPSPFRENQICVAWRQARLSVRPGITGLWQICRAPDRSQGDFHEWIYYDMAYVRHFSLWLDIKILFATLLTLGGHRHVPLSWMIGGLDGYGRRPLGHPAT
ncbi:MAG TPA: sugar transferase [Phycisphaerae bacterium]|nr:sugar transferase [Phycisphaerae bacterium]